MSYETSLRFRHTAGATSTADTHFTVAVDHARTGRFEEAAEAFRTVLSFVPDRTEAWQGLGYCYRKLRAFAQANEAYGEAQRLDPSRGAMWFNAPVAAIGLR
jgi:Flp pilus assembly protein TadD